MYIGIASTVLLLIDIGVGTSISIDGPLALGLKVGLHGGVPLLPVGASEHGDQEKKKTPECQ